MKNLPEFLGSKFIGGCLLVIVSLMVSWGVSREISAQVMFGSVTGKVLDINGNPVRRTLVTLISDKDGLKLATIVERSGEFFFINLMPGVYSLRAAQPGFKTAIA